MYPKLEFIPANVRLQQGDCVFFTFALTGHITVASMKEVPSNFYPRNAQSVTAPELHP